MQMPPFPRAVAFIDGQNLFYAAKEAFGYTYPNYDPLKLARALCNGQGAGSFLHRGTGSPRRRTLAQVLAGEAGSDGAT